MSSASNASSDPGSAEQPLQLTLLEVDETGSRDAAVHGTLELSLQERQRARGRARLVDGRDVVWRLPRRVALVTGSRLVSGGGDIIEVRAASERLSEVHAEDSFALMRAAYHLGNRHVMLQIAPGLLRYPCDHVLDDMVRGLGLSVSEVLAPFEPEHGAYAPGGHSHGHSHTHAEDEQTRDG